MKGRVNVSKYRNRKTCIEGEVFDSVKESQRWMELRLLQAAGEITNLDRQVKYTLIPAQKRNGHVERPVIYVADFQYEENGEIIVEDVKSDATKTHAYIIKRKLMLWQYGIIVKEV